MSATILADCLDANAIAAMQARYAASVDRTVAAALAGREDAEAHREPLRDYIVTAARFGRTVGHKAAAELALQSPAQIDAARARLRDPLPATARAIARLAGWMRNDASRYESLFQGQDRLYVPLPRDVMTRTRREVAGVLQRHGYSVTDYAGGYATDAKGKQQFRIGKLLNKLMPYLADDFQNDSTRSGSAMLLCLSRDPEDVARMSTGRSWTSCMAKGGFAYDHVKYEIAKGSLVAYMVSENDPDITRPLARITLKPYADSAGHRILRAASSYGLSDEVFEAAVDRLADAMSAGAPSGRYRVRGGVYPDSLAYAFSHFGPETTAQQLFDSMGVGYTVQANGRLLVTENVFACNRDMTVLPDLTGVDFHGDLHLSGNRLTSLHGLPRAIGGDLTVDGNRLTDLSGAPETVGGEFSATDNRLVTLAGAPRHVGGDFDVRRNVLVDLRGAPERIDGQADLRQNPLLTLQGLGVVAKQVSSDLGSFVRSASVPRRLSTAPQPGMSAR